VQSYLAEIVDALKTREKKKEAKRQAALDEQWSQWRTAFEAQHQTQRTSNP
jgi:hypothetical protein